MLGAILFHVLVVHRLSLFYVGGKGVGSPLLLRLWALWMWMRGRVTWTSRSGVSCRHFEPYARTPMSLDADVHDPKVLLKPCAINVWCDISGP